MSIIYGWCKINPNLGPKGERSSWRERISSLREVAPVGVIFIVVMGGMTNGFFTPTEAGAVGAFTVAIVALVKRDINLKGIIKSMGESLVTTSMVILLILGSTIFGHFITVTKIPLFVGDWILSLPLHPSIVVILIGLIYLVGGSFIDDLAFMILATPIFYPVIVRLGYDLIWFDIPPDRSDDWNHHPADGGEYLRGTKYHPSANMGDLFRSFSVLDQFCVLCISFNPVSPNCSFSTISFCSVKEARIHSKP